MVRYAKSVWAVLAAGMLFLTACGAPQEPQTPTPDPNAVLTAAVQTVAAELTRSAALTPSVTPTATLEPTATQEPTPEVTVAPTTAATAATATVNAPTTAEKPDKAAWVFQDPADNEKVSPGQGFNMVWKVKNTGTTTWSTKYLLRFFAGDQMAAPAVVSFPKEVKPNEEVELTVKMVAPGTAGKYNSWWKVTNAEGMNFYDLSVTIEVTGTPAATATNTVEPTATATTGTTTP